MSFNNILRKKILNQTFYFRFRFKKSYFQNIERISCLYDIESLSHNIMEHKIYTCISFREVEKIYAARSVWQQAVGVYVSADFITRIRCLEVYVLNILWNSNRTFSCSAAYSPNLIIKFLWKDKKETDIIKTQGISVFCLQTISTDV